MPSLTSTEPTARRREAEQWCDAFDENTKKFLKTSVCSWKGEAPELTYEDIDTRLLTPRPRLYGLVGAEVIEQVWKERTESKPQQASEKSLVGAGSH
jgi:succinate dehydrogenase / fumarate reductase flavoprotein subunit